MKSALAESFRPKIARHLTAHRKQSFMISRPSITPIGGDFDLRRQQREIVMPTIIAHHNISKDAKHWLSSPKRQEVFGALGVTNIRTFVDPQNPTRVAVMMDVPDMDAMNAAMQGKAVADAMAFDGVVPESVAILVES